MKIYAASSSLDISQEMAADVLAQLSFDDSPSLLFVFLNANYDADLIRQLLHDALQCPLLIATSSHGGFICSPLVCDASASLTVLAIVDPKGSYGVGMAHVGEIDGRQAASMATQRALQNSATPFESPSLIWCVPTPGTEEQMLEGVADVVGPNIPVFGGSCADNDVTGNWQAGDQDEVGPSTISVVVMTPSSPLGMTFSSGYQPTETAVTVTEAANRTLFALDDEPAALRYNTVTNDAIKAALSGGQILDQSSLHPLGLEITSPVGIPEFLLIHPASINKDNSLQLFADVTTGTRLQVMEGSISGLVNRAEKVIQNAIDLVPQYRTVEGVLLVYCAGCMMTIHEQLPLMCSRVQSRFPHLPVVGMYSFGEQGRFLDNQNRHGNLMISAIAFSS